jgi:hypothetical protein
MPIYEARTAPHPVMALPPKWYQFLIGVFASLGSFLFGYDLGVIAEVVASPNFAAKFKPNDVQSGLVVSMFTTGAFFWSCFRRTKWRLSGSAIDYLSGSAHLLSWRSSTDWSSEYSLPMEREILRWARSW